MKLIWITLTLFISLSSFASALLCQAEGEDLRFENVRYPGGARPRPGMLIGRTSWIYQYQTIYLEREYEPCNDRYERCEIEGTNEGDVASNIGWEFLQDTKVVISSENQGGYFFKEVYSIQIKLFSTEPGTVITGLPWETKELKFICEDIRVYYP